MNFLAHLFLSCDEEELLVGNFIADFVKNRELVKYSGGVQKGIFLHRQIDSYTDTHPLVLRGARRLYPDHSKYASVIIDVFYDHLLAVNWKMYAEQELSEFAQQTYRLLERHAATMPPVLQERLPHMIADDWLTNYASPERVAFTIDRMKRRASRPQLLDGAADNLLRDYGEFESEFHLFFPDIQAFVEKICGG